MDFYNPTGSMDDTALDLPYGVAIPSKELNLLMSYHYGAELFDLSADRPFISKVDPSQYNKPHQLFTS